MSTSKLVTLLFISKTAAFAVIDWLDAHRDAMVLTVFFFVIALLFWTGTFGPPSPPSEYAPHPDPYQLMSVSPFFDGVQPLPNPRPEDCIIVPLDNPLMLVPTDSVTTI